MIVEFSSVSAPVAQLGSQLSLLLVSPFILIFCRSAQLWNNTTPKWHPPYVNAHETPTRFLYPGDKKRLVRQGGPLWGTRRLVIDLQGKVTAH